MEGGTGRDGKMQIAVRLRPFHPYERQTNARRIIEMSDNLLTVLPPEEDTDSKQFRFDHCLWSHSDFDIDDKRASRPDSENSRYVGQEEVFKAVGAPLVKKAYEGYNVAILSYGTTGSGKTYTMLGVEGDRGLVYRFTEQLFAELGKDADNKYKVTFSMFELYNEMVVDLLTSSSGSKGGLKVRESKEDGIYIQDLTEVPVRTSAQIGQVIEQGIRSRIVAATKMNASSSRSHVFITISLQQFIVKQDGTRINRKSRIRLVDMAGSERASQTGATGATLMEGQAINRSISGLAAVILALADQSGKQKFIPYRDSKFTRILRDELGGNCCTTVIASIGPADVYYPDTLATLRLADRAAHITQKAVLNEVLTDDVISSLQDKIAQLEESIQNEADESTKQVYRDQLAMARQKLQEVEAVWKEKDSKEMPGTWWSVTAKMEMPEIETCPYLQNVSEDPQFSGLVKHVLTQGSILLGKKDTGKVTLELEGLGIQARHAILNNTGSSVTIVPCSQQARVHVNGQQIHSLVTLAHLDRVKLGAHEMFVYVGFPSERGTAQASKYTHDTFLMELAEKHPLARDIQPAPDCSSREKTAALILFHQFSEILLEVEKANAIAALFEKNLDYSLLLDRRKEKKEFCVKVTDKGASKECVLALPEFLTARQLMEEWYDELLTTGRKPKPKAGQDPFHIDDKEILLSSGKLELGPLAYLLSVEEAVSLLDVDGKPTGNVLVSIKPYDADGKLLDSDETFVEDPKEQMGRYLSLCLQVLNFEEISWAAVNPSRGIHCKISMFGQPKPVATDTVYGKASGEFGSTFNFIFTQVTQQLLDFLQNESLTVELWGEYAKPGTGDQQVTTEAVAALPTTHPETTAAHAVPEQATSPPDKKETEQKEPPPPQPQQQQQQQQQQEQHQPAEHKNDISSEQTAEKVVQHENETNSSVKSGKATRQSLDGLLAGLDPVKEKLAHLRERALKQHSSEHEDRTATWVQFATELQEAENMLNLSMAALREMAEKNQNDPGSTQNPQPSQSSSRADSRVTVSGDKSKTCLIQ